MLNHYYADKLTVTELAAMRALNQAVMSRAGSCNLGGVDPRGVSRIIHAALTERPDSFDWKSGIASLRREGSSVWMRLSYIDSDREETLRAARAVSDEIRAKLTQNATDYDKCLAVHEWITAHVSYEYELLEKYGTVRGAREATEAFFSDPVDAACFTAMGALVNRRAVCQGVALAVAYLLRGMGVQVTCARGQNENGVPHFWNIVEADGERYVLDCSSDITDSRLPVMRYEHFMMPEYQYRKSFTFTENFGCESKVQNYFVKNGLYFTSMRGVRKYLESYRFEGDGAVRLWYEGSESDAKLRDTAVAVLRSRLGERLTLCPQALVRNGTVTMKMSVL